MAEVLSITALNRYVKAKLDSDDLLFDIAVRGEISNFNRNFRSGHCYFSLKDNNCSVKAVMFRSDASRMHFEPENGMLVVVRCRATVYERDGAFQLYVKDIFPDGIGSVQLAFEQLKEKLYAEGLFNPEYKKPIPGYPEKIAVITSKTGAALQDILNVMSRRWPLVSLILYPVNVQGAESAEAIAHMIARADADGNADIIIVARGGGSREDLWVFNAECIARAAFACKTPLISAIGHEIDTTILDYVADLRAPTPSAAAELAVPDREECRNRINFLNCKIYEYMQNKVEMCYNSVALYESGTLSGALHSRIDAMGASADKLNDDIKRSALNQIESREKDLRHFSAVAQALSPYHILSAGYGKIYDENGANITADALSEGQAFQLEGARHMLECTVNRVKDK